MSHSVSRVVLAGVVGLTLAGVCGPALAFDDGYQDVFSSVLTAVGVMPPPSTPEIDYRERAPLVLPPKAGLVKPIAPGAHRTAAWPTDPDVVRRRKAAEDAASPIALFEKTDRPIPKDELMRYRAAQPAEDVEPSGCRAFERSMVNCRPNPEQMKQEEQRFKAANPERSEATVAGVEPDRLYLTQPPRGYLKATKTVAATHEAPAKHRDESHPLSSIQPGGSKNIDPLSN